MREKLKINKKTYQKINETLKIEINVYCENVNMKNIINFKRIIQSLLKHIKNDFKNAFNEIDSK